MYTVRANIVKNRLYVTLSGFMHQQEMKECTDRTIEESQKLQPGYDVITDISDFKVVGQETLAEVKRGQAYFKQTGVRHAIRVEGKSSISGLVSSQFTRTGRSVAYVPETVATMADAERILDELSRQAVTK